jgi:hypothetical protein
MQSEREALGIALKLDLRLMRQANVAEARHTDRRRFRWRQISQVLLVSSLSIHFF